jgi:hypothetical protein
MRNFIWINKLIYRKHLSLINITYDEIIIDWRVFSANSLHYYQYFVERKRIMNLVDSSGRENDDEITIYHWNCWKYLIIFTNYIVLNRRWFLKDLSFKCSILIIE